MSSEQFEQLCAVLMVGWLLVAAAAFWVCGLAGSVVLACRSAASVFALIGCGCEL